MLGMSLSSSGSPTNALVAPAPRVPPPAADPPQRSDQAYVPDGMRQLRPPSGVEKREQVELPGVVRPMAATADSRDAKGVSASAQRTRYEVGGVHYAIVAAYRTAGDGGLLGVRRLH